MTFFKTFFLLTLTLALPAGGTLFAQHAAPSTKDWKELQINFQDTDSNKGNALRAALREKHNKTTVDPIFPEDGSLPTSKWFFSASELLLSFPAPSDEEIKKVTDIFKGTGVNPISVKMPHGHGYPQDHMLFDCSGGFIEQAPPPVKNDVLAVTQGVYSPGDFEGEITLRYIHGDISERVCEGKMREMELVFVEGGALITGRFVSNNPKSTYAITTTSTIFNVRNINAWRQELKRNYNAKLTDDEIKYIIAKDLGIYGEDGKPNPDNIIIVETSKHLDLLMFPLPGGKILLNDSVLARDRFYRSVPEKKRLELPLFTDPENAIKKALLEFNAKSKNYKFQIIPVAGNSATVAEKYVFNKYDDKYINFLNASSIKTPSGKHIIITNAAEREIQLKDNKTKRVRLKVRSSIGVKLYKSTAALRLKIFTL